MQLISSVNTKWYGILVHSKQNFLHGLLQFTPTLQATVLYKSKDAIWQQWTYDELPNLDKHHKVLLESDKSQENYSIHNWLLIKTSQGLVQSIKCSLVTAHLLAQDFFHKFLVVCYKKVFP